MAHKDHFRQERSSRGSRISCGGLQLKIRNFIVLRMPASLSQKSRVLKMDSFAVQGTTLASVLCPKPSAAQNKRSHMSSHVTGLVPGASVPEVIPSRTSGNAIVHTWHLQWPGLNGAGPGCQGPGWKHAVVSYTTELGLKSQLWHFSGFVERNLCCGLEETVIIKRKRNWELPFMLIAAMLMMFVMWLWDSIT